MTTQRKEHTAGGRAGQPVHLEKLFSCVLVSFTVVHVPACTLWEVGELFMSFLSLEKSKMTCACILVLYINT